MPAAVAEAWSPPAMSFLAGARRSMGAKGPIGCARIFVCVPRRSVRRRSRRRRDPRPPDLACAPGSRGWEEVLGRKRERKVLRYGVKSKKKKRRGS